MILYNSLLAKIILNRKRNKREHYFMVFGCCFTRYKYLEIWEDMELRIHERQYFECFLLALMPSLVLSLLFSWWFMLLALFSYHLLYWAEMVRTSFLVWLGSTGILWWYPLFKETKILCLDEMVWKKNIATLRMGRLNTVNIKITGNAIGTYLVFVSWLINM